MLTEQELMAVKAVLERSKLLLQQGQCKEYFAVGPRGGAKSPYDPKAVAWCAVGALMRATRDLNVSQDVESCAQVRLFAEGVRAGMNDAEGDTLPAVLAGYDRALAKLAEEVGK